MPALDKRSGSAVLVRLAGVHEAAAIASVLHDSFDEFQRRYTTEGFIATTPCEDRVRSRMREGPSWVAVVQDTIVGTASAVSKTDGCLYIRGMAVLPAARGQKIGEWLLREIECYALKQGCLRLSLTTTPFLSSAIRLYERFGFRFVADGPANLFGTPLLNMSKLLLGESEYYEQSRKEGLCRKIMDTLVCA